MKKPIVKLVGEDGNAYGQFETCGVRPNLVGKLKAEGIEIPPALFQRHIFTEAAESKSE